MNKNEANINEMCEGTNKMINDTLELIVTDIFNNF